MISPLLIFSLGVATSAAPTLEVLPSNDSRAFATVGTSQQHLPTVAVDASHSAAKTSEISPKSSEVFPKTSDVFAGTSDVSPKTSDVASSASERSANPPQVSAMQRQLWRTLSLWLHTRNAAGLSFDPQPNVARGESSFAYAYADGSLRTLQQGSSQGVGTFHAQQQLPLSSWLMAEGSIAYALSQYRQRAWDDRSDLWAVNTTNMGDAEHLFPLRSNTLRLSPLTAGSDRAGGYDEQTIASQFRLATRNRPAWNFGLGVEYAVNDLARLKDPRSRARLLSYRVAPAAVWTGKGLHLGASAWYARQKEKIDNVTTVQQDAQFPYYTLEGLTSATGGVGAYQGFQRQWVEHLFGGEATVGGTLGTLAAVSALSYERFREEAVGAVRYTPTTFTGERWKWATMWRWQSDAWWHTWHKVLTWERGYTDERLQSLVLTTDPTTKIVSRHYQTLVTLHQRFQTERVAAELSYKATHVRPTAPLSTSGQTLGQQSLGTGENQPSTSGVGAGTQVDAWWGVALRYEGHTQRYHLPLSERMAHRMMVAAEGAKLWGTRLWTEVQVGTSFALRQRLSLAQPTSVLAPLWEEQALRDAPAISRAALSVRYDIPVRWHGTALQFFAKVKADHAQAWAHALHGTTFSLTLGVLH